MLESDARKVAAACSLLTARGVMGGSSSCHWNSPAPAACGGGLVVVGEQLQQALWQACRHCSAPEVPAGLGRPHQAGRRAAGAEASCVGRWLRAVASWREGREGLVVVGV